MANNHNSVTADGLAAVSRLVDITRNDIVQIEQILIIGTATEKPITGRVAILEEKLSALSMQLERLELLLKEFKEINKAGHKLNNQRIVRIERIVWMISGAMVILGAASQLFVDFFKGL